MKLTPQEQAWLTGEAGPGTQRAMEIVTALGKIFGAEKLVPIDSAHVAGVSYKNLGEAGVGFLEDLAAKGASVRVPTTLNPAGLDLQAWEHLGFDPTFAQNQARVIDAYRAFGITITCSCTPYQIGYEPAFGGHLAWSESSAGIFANSVIGARTNREGGPGSLSAALTGRAAAYGLHLDANRQPTHVVNMAYPVRTYTDFGALGFLIGKSPGHGVPYVRGIDPEAATTANLKAMGAAMASSSDIALFHVEGVTPEAVRGLQPAPGTPEITHHSAESVDVIDEPVDLDLVWMGCPHATIAEIRRVVDLLDGRQVKAPLWITTARPIREEAARLGLLQALESCGGEIVADTCVVVAPIRALGFHHVATNSRKGAFYAPGHNGADIRFGDVAALVEAAVSGRWEGGRS